MFRIWWAFAIIVSLIFCIYLIRSAYRRWDEHPILMSFATTPTSVWEVPFPAITICPEVKAQKELFNFTKTIEKLVFDKNASLDSDT